jgi:urease accessory protein
LNLELFHLCDSLFPLGGFAYSDGLESATSAGRVADVAGLRAWLDAVLDDTIGRMEGPAVWRAWSAFAEADVDALIRIDEELTALRPSSAARQSTRAMGLRLLTTWRTLHPDPRLEHASELVRQGRLGPTLPVAFAGACACGGTPRRASVEAFAYTRLAATISAAMRLMPIGQTDAHVLLSRALERAPAAIDRIASGQGDLQSFTPLMDVETMTQQYLHSRMFRS